MYGRVVVDRDKTSSYDFDQTGSGRTISGTGSVVQEYSWTPANTGVYYCSNGVQVTGNGFTDGSPWSDWIVVTVTAPTGTLNITANNLPAGNQALPGSNGYVKLYTSAGSPIGSEQQTNSNGETTFTDVPAGSNYYYEVRHNDQSTIFGTEYWGKQTGIQITGGQQTNSTFTRNMPYGTELKVYIVSTGSDVTGQSVPSGTPLRLEFTMENPSSSSVSNVYGRVVADRNKALSYDFDQTGPGRTISGTGSVVQEYLWTPTITGDYYCSNGVLVTGNGYTDGAPWSDWKLVTVTAPIQLVIEECSVSPSTQHPGGRVTVIYQIDNPATSSVKTGLMCSIAPTGTTNWLSDPDHDRDANVPSGTTTHEREFDIPESADLGLYTVWYVLQKGGISGEGYYDTLERDDLTVAGKRPKLVLYGIPVDFGLYNTYKTFTIANEGNMDLVITDILSSKSFFSVNTREMTIRPYERKTVGIYFDRNTNKGMKSGELTFVIKDNKNEPFWHGCVNLNWLATDGKHIVERDNPERKVTLRGLNVSGWQYSQELWGNTNEEIAHYIDTICESWDINIVRIPFNQEFWMDSDSEYKNKIIHVVDCFKRHHVYVLLDLHWIDYFPRKTVETSPLPNDQSIEMWKDIAQVFNNDPAVLYDIYNEPTHEASFNEWRNKAIEIIEAIRTIDIEKKHLIWVSGNNWGFNLDDFKSNPLNYENIVYSTHIYPIKLNENIKIDDEGNVIVRDIDWKFTPSKFPNWWRNWPDKPLFVGEFGPMEDEADSLQRIINYIDPLLNEIDKTAIGWLAWAYNDAPLIVEDRENPNPNKLSKFGERVKEKLLKWVKIRGVVSDTPETPDLIIKSIHAFTDDLQQFPVAGEKSAIRILIPNVGRDTWEGRELIALVNVVDKYDVPPNGFWTGIWKNDTIRQNRHIRLGKISNITPGDIKEITIPFMFTAPDFSDLLYVELLSGKKNEIVDTRDLNNSIELTPFFVRFNNEAYINCLGEVLTGLSHGVVDSKYIDVAQKGYDLALEGRALISDSHEIIEELKKGDEESAFNAGYKTGEDFNKLMETLYEKGGDELVDEIVPFVEAANNEFNGVGCGAAIGHSILHSFLKGKTQAMAKYNNYITVIVSSPSDLIIEQNGKIVSINQYGNSVTDIDNSLAYLFGPIKVVQVPESNDNYNLTLKGTDEGTTDVVIIQKKEIQETQEYLVETITYEDIPTKMGSEASREIGNEFDEN